MPSSPPHRLALPPRRLVASQLRYQSFNTICLIISAPSGLLLARFGCSFFCAETPFTLFPHRYRLRCVDAARSLLNFALTAAPRPLNSLTAMSGNVWANLMLLQLLTPHIRLIYPNASQQCAVRSC